MFGPFSDPVVAVEIGDVFGRASERIREARVRSADRENVGNRARVETSDTDDLIDQFESSVRASLDSLHDRVIRERTEFGVEFYPTNLPVSEESRFGADFGVRLHLEADGFNLTKGLLFQCKRMYGNAPRATYEALRGDGEAQAAKMLAVTPASFFLLFNGVRLEIVASWIKTPACLYPFDEILSPWSLNWRFRNSIEQFRMWNPGVTVLPASRVYAESRVARIASKSLSVDAEHWARASIPLGIFMADFFGSCFVGDVRESILRLVTPPKLRDLGAIGVEDDISLMSIKRIMDIRAVQKSD